MMTPRTPSHVVNPKRAAGTENTFPVTDFDVRCGKDRSNLGHMGNKRFQAIIALNIPRYRRAGKKRGIKSNIVKAVLKDVRSLGSRFFQKKGEDWIQVVEDRIMFDKIGHALRDSCSNDTFVRAEGFMNLNGLEYDNEDDIAVTIATVAVAVGDHGDVDEDEVYIPLLVLDDPALLLKVLPVVLDDPSVLMDVLPAVLSDPSILLEVLPATSRARRQSWREASPSEPYPFAALYVPALLHPVFPVATVLAEPLRSPMVLVFCDVDEQERKASRMQAENSSYGHLEYLFQPGHEGELDALLNDLR